MFAKLVCTVGHPRATSRVPLTRRAGPRSSPVSSGVRLGQGFGRGLVGGLADVVVDGLSDDARGQVVEMGVELLGECEVLGPDGFLGARGQEACRMVERMNVQDERGSACATLCQLRFGCRVRESPTPTR